jgi:hypothetical protein
MMSLGTDFETHAYGQAYGEEHLRPVNAVTHLFGDVDLDADQCKVKASAAKDFEARKKSWGTVNYHRPKSINLRSLQ